MLDLPIGTKVYLVSRLYDGNRKVRNYTLFFRLNGALPADGFAGTTVESISIKPIA
jgi:hypothetical protein